MLQDQSRNRTPMPAAQPPASAAPPEPGPARAEAGIARMLTEPPKVAAPIEADLAAACIAQLERLKWWDAHPGSLTEQEGDAEMDRWGAVFRRAIEEPSTGIADLAAKSRLMQEDLERFFPASRYAADNFRLMRAILQEVVALGAAASAPEADPVLAGVATTRAAYDRAIAVFEQHRREKPGQDLPAAWTSAADAAHDAFLRLVASTAPTTLAGSQALARLYLDVREGLGVDDEHETTIVLRRIAGDPSPTSAGTTATTRADPHPVLMPEVMRLWYEHRRTMSGWGASTDSLQDKAAGAAHNAFVEACLALVELPPPETPEGFAALVTAIGLAFEGCVDEESDETIRAFGALIRASVHASGAVMPADWEGPFYAPEAGSDAHAPSGNFAPETQALSEGSVGRGVQEREDPIHAAIEEHDAARAAWVDAARAANETPITDSAYDLAAAAAEGPEHREFETYKALTRTAPTTFGGLAALARYLPRVIHRGAGSEAGSDTLSALLAVCSAIGSVAYAAEAAVSLALRERHGEVFDLSAALEDRRARTDAFFKMIELAGFVPHPADKPRCLMAVDLAIPLEAERLLSIAKREFDRRAEVYADYPALEREWHLAFLRAEYRLDELAAVVIGRAPNTERPVVERLLSTWRDLAPYMTARASDDGSPDISDAVVEGLLVKHGEALNAADKLPATLDNLLPKALALAAIEAVETLAVATPRNALEVGVSLVLDLHTAIAGHGNAGHVGGAA